MLSFTKQNKLPEPKYFATEIGICIALLTDIRQDHGQHLEIGSRIQVNVLFVD